MANALEMFKQQKAVAGELLEMVRAIQASLQAVRVDVDAIVRHDALRTVLVDEQRWLQRTEALVEKVRTWHYDEAQRFGRPLVWRWAVATAFALLATVAAGAGYVWAARPYADEIAYLRSRDSFATAVESRMLHMSPAERRQLEALLQLPAPSK